MGDIASAAEYEVRLGSHVGGDKYINWYGGFGRGTAWCAIFVSYCAYMAGVLGSKVPKYASCWAGVSWFRSQGRFQPRENYWPRRGDVVFFSSSKYPNGGAHTGIVVSVTTSAITLIEGNTSNSVAYRTYSKGGGSTSRSYTYASIYGFGITNTAANNEQNGVPVGPSTGGNNTNYINKSTSTGDSSALTGAPAAPVSVPITTVVIKSIEGDGGVYKYTDLKSAQSVIDAGVEIMIQNDKIYLPVVSGDVTLEQERKNTPGCLKFSVVKDGVLNIQEGNPVRMRVDGRNVFYGYIFSKSRTDSDIINITCYDQIRYLKNKDTIAYSNQTYGGLLQLIAKRYNLTLGDVEDTEFVMPPRIEEGTLLDMLMNASDMTVLNKATGNKLYVLYDDFGELSLKNIENMMLPILIEKDTASEYSYTSTIDSGVYNKIMLAADNSVTGQREVYVAQDPESQSNWGILQYYEKMNDSTDEIMKEKARVLLNYYNKKGRTLSIRKCFGDIRVRGGSSLPVMLNIGDMEVRNFMVVEKVKHTFSDGLHLMDLILIGIRGEFRV